MPDLAAASGDGTRGLFVLSGVLLVASLIALSIDCPLAHWILQGNCPKWVVGSLNLLEPFGHGLGVAVLVLAIHQLDAARRWALPRVLACCFGAGLATNGIKMLVARARPHHFDFDGGVWGTFGGWFPLTAAGSGNQSFASAHTATAVGLAMALIWLYPAGRRLFITLAVLVAAQRLVTGAHYLSDVLFGAALGVVVGTACLKAGRLAERFERWEDRWRARKSPAPAPVVRPLPGTAVSDEDAEHNDRRFRRAS